ncbi:MAG: hypothetical protein K2P99_05045, partial [Burkholderiales bacterium]|nr:hypothetical protein [Burkholderiales bacterium]
SSSIVKPEKPQKTYADSSSIPGAVRDDGTKYLYNTVNGSDGIFVSGNPRGASSTLPLPSGGTLRNQLSQLNFNSRQKAKKPKVIRLKE